MRLDIVPERIVVRDGHPDGESVPSQEEHERCHPQTCLLTVERGPEKTDHDGTHNTEVREVGPPVEIRPIPGGVGRETVLGDQIR